MDKRSRMGKLYLTVGPMSAAKSQQLIIKANNVSLCREKSCVIYKPLGHRQKNLVSSRDGLTRYATETETLCEVLGSVAYEKATHVFVDEGQMFQDLVEFSEEAIRRGKRIYVYMLDGTWRREPWPQLGSMVSIASSVIKLTAVCPECGRAAPFSMKKGGNGETIDLADEVYQAACGDCYRLYVPVPLKKSSE